MHTLDQNTTVAKSGPRLTLQNLESFRVIRNRLFTVCLIWFNCFCLPCVSLEILNVLFLQNCRTVIISNTKSHILFSALQCLMLINIKPRVVMSSETQFSFYFINKIVFIKRPAPWFLCYTHVVSNPLISLFVWVP